MLIVEGLHPDYLHILVNLTGVGKRVEGETPNDLGWSAVQRSCSARLNRMRFWIVLLLGPKVLATEEDDRRS